MLSSFLVVAFVYITITILPVDPSKTWTYELLEITCITSNPDIFDCNFEIERLNRIEFGVNGFIDIKADLYDDLTIENINERSLNRTGPYNPFPFSLENQTLSQFMNGPYKIIFQQNAAECTENFPIVEDHFDAPLNKCCIILSGCQVNTENLPSMPLDGYHKSDIKVSGPVEVHVTLLALIENIS